jgi:hypothetical protein
LHMYFEAFGRRRFLRLSLKIIRNRKIEKRF